MFLAVFFLGSAIFINGFSEESIPENPDWPKHTQVLHGVHLLLAHAGFTKLQSRSLGRLGSGSLKCDSVALDAVC